MSRETADGVLAQYRMYIGGKWCHAEGQRCFTSANPYTGQDWAQIPLGTARDVDTAVRAAADAFDDWRRTLGKERSRLLRTLAGIVASRADELARIETRDNGKLLRETTAQVQSLPDYYEYWAGWADKVQGQVIPLGRPNIFHYTLREPLGVIAAITAWNSPLLLLTWKIAPALAVGNTIVAKPSEHASASTLEFARLIEEAGFPPGVFNVITGPGRPTSECLVAHPAVRKIAFTGGGTSARAVAHAAAENLVPVQLELGGKSPQIVFADADIDAAAEGIAAGIFGASGQSCVAGSRLLVDQAIADELVAKLVQRADAIRLGDPTDAGTQMGPVCFKLHQQRIQEFVARAVEQGAVVAAGGVAPASPSLARGYFFRPTVLTDVQPTMEVAREEVFGPVLSVLRFRTEAEAIRMANDSDYGLGAGIWTAQIGRAHRVAASLDVGIVWVNTYRMSSYAAPWGGHKRSGYGRESGPDAIGEYTQLKSVWVEIGVPEA